MTVITYIPQLLQGVWITLLLVTCALSIGIILAMLMTLGVISKRPYLSAPINALVFFIRGTPLLVQFFLIYYGSGQFEWLRDSALWTVLREPFACAVLALALNTSAYTTALFKGAIEAVPKTEIMAAHALGMSKALTMRRIMLPIAFRLALPAYSNEVVIVLKGSSLASTITILDLMGVTNQLIGQTYESMKFLAIAGGIYLVLNALVISLFKVIERRINIHLRQH